MHTRSKFRLLIVRLGAMGDILHALPAVTALRKEHPEWVIDWAIEPRWGALLSALEAAAGPPSSSRRPPSQPVVDGLQLVPTREWRKAPLHWKTLSEVRNLCHSLRSGSYDVVLDLQGAIRSALVARMAGSHRVIGEANPREKSARWLFTEQVITQGAHVIEQDFELAAAVAGDELKPLLPLLPVDEAAEAWADGILSPQASRPAVLINPGAGWGAKRWPIERYAITARELAAHGFQVLVNTGPGEEELARVMSQATGQAVPLHCSLSQLIAVTRRVKLAIAGDTGPLHLACALGRPVVAIYGPTDPSRNGPYGTSFKILRSPESRRDHSRNDAPEAGLLTISPDEVLAAAGELLAEGSPS